MHRLLAYLAMAASANAVILLNGLDVLEAALSHIPTDTATCTGQVVAQPQDCGDCSASAKGGLVGVQYHCLPWSVTTVVTVATTTVQAPPPVVASTTSPLAASTSSFSWTVVSTEAGLIPGALITSSLSTSPSFTTTTRPTSDSSVSSTPSATTEPHKSFVHSPGGVGLFATLGLLVFGAIVGSLLYYVNKREAHHNPKPETPPEEIEMQRPASSTYDSEDTAVARPDSATLPDSPGPYMNWYTGEYYAESPKQTPELEEVTRRYRKNAFRAAAGRSGSPVRRGIREGSTPYDLPV